MAVTSEAIDILIVGAGFGGLHMLHEARRRGFSARLVEAAPDVGGAWYWNRYPGARCDVESLVYSYSFAPEIDAEWHWSERYAGQKEIQAYLRFVSERLDLRRDIRFEQRVVAASFDEAKARWIVSCNGGQSFEARFCIMATGPITVPTLPDIEGIESFRGEMFHTARWPQTEPDFTGKRVGVIGTGSSGTQLIPIVAREAEKLTVFLRTPNFTVPARNGPMDEERLREWDRRRDEVRAAMWRGEIAGVGDVHMPEQLRLTRTTPAAEFTPEQRREILETRWRYGGAVLQGSFRDVMTDPKVNDEVADFVREKIRETVADPEKARLLTPTGYHLGTKRLCVGTDYYETYNRENVEIADVQSTPIARFTEIGILVGDREIPLDILIFATGFDALTGALGEIDLRGRAGITIQEAWAEGPQTYLGLAVHGFPNLFLIGGPGSPSVFSNVVMTNEYQVGFIADLIAEADRNGDTIIEAEANAQVEWTGHVANVVERSLLANAKSWYVGANIPGKPRTILAYVGGVPAYRARCDAVRAAGFEGFRREGAVPAIFQSTGTAG